MAVMLRSQGVPARVVTGLRHRHLRLPQRGLCRHLRRGPRLGGGVLPRLRLGGVRAHRQPDALRLRQPDPGGARRHPGRPRASPPACPPPCSRYCWRWAWRAAWLCWCCCCASWDAVERPGAKIDPVRQAQAHYFTVRRALRLAGGGCRQQRHPQRVPGAGRGRGWRSARGWPAPCSRPPRFTRRRPSARARPPPARWNRRGGRGGGRSGNG